MGESGPSESKMGMVGRETKLTPPGLGEVVAQSTAKNIKDSGVRTRKIEMVGIHNPETPNSEPTPEQREKAKELQKKVVELSDHYGVSLQEDTNNSWDHLLLCLDPETQEYIHAHLTKLDALVWAAEYMPEDLPKAERGVKVWEDLAMAGTRPTDFVDDGLEVDAENMIILREFLEAAESNIYQGQYKRIAENFKRNRPELARLLEHEGKLRDE